MAYTNITTKSGEVAVDLGKLNWAKPIAGGIELSSGGAVFRVDAEHCGQITAKTGVEPGPRKKRAYKPLSEIQAIARKRQK